MRFTAHLPNQYKEMAKIKTDNYPFMPVLNAFILSLIHLQAREDLEFFALFGRVESALAADTELKFPTRLAKNDKGVDINFESSDNEVIEFFREAPTTNKNTMVIIVRTIMRLSQKYSQSLSELIYRIDALEPPASLVISPEPVLESAAPKIAHQSAVKPRTNSATPAPETPEQIPAKPLKIGKPKAASESPSEVSSEAPEVTTSEAPKSASDTPPATPIPEPSKADEILRRAEAMTKEVSDLTKNAGEVVEPNKLLDGFFDF